MNSAPIGIGASAFSLLSWGQCISDSQVGRFASCVAEICVTQSSFEPNCLFCIKRDADGTLVRFGHSILKLMFPLADLKISCEIFLFKI